MQEVTSAGSASPLDLGKRDYKSRLEERRCGRGCTELKQIVHQPQVDSSFTFSGASGRGSLG